MLKRVCYIINNNQNHLGSHGDKVTVKPPVKDAPEQGTRMIKTSTQAIYSPE